MNEDILNTSNHLYKQAYEIIETMGLNNLLSNYGNLDIVGSAKYNLMTWRDIDFDLITPVVLETKMYWKIVQKIFDIPGVKNLILEDNRDLKEKNRPKSMYIGINYEGSLGKVWKLDIRLLAKEDATTNDIESLIEKNLTEQTKLVILEIKSQVHDSPKYHKEFSSVDIYKAVLSNDVTNLKEFERYLKTLGKKL